jgi:hypothetical protein
MTEEKNLPSLRRQAFFGVQQVPRPLRNATHTKLDAITIGRAFQKPEEVT